MAPTHAVDLVVGVVAEGEHVAVAGEALAHLGRQRQTDLLRAEQNLRRAEGPGRQNDDIRLDELIRRVEYLAAGGERPVGDEPAPAGTLRDRTDRDLGVDLGAVVVGVGEIVHEDGVLGTEVAARHAVSGEGARLLVDTGHIDVVLEADVDVQPVERARQRRRRLP